MKMYLLFFVKWSDYKKIKEYLKNYDKEKIEEYVEVSQNEFEMQMKGGRTMQQQIYITQIKNII